MRPGALLPLVCSAAAVVLAFLCLFAGHQKNFMESYDVMTLNVSRIGQGLVNTSAIAEEAPSFLEGLVKNITDEIADHFDDAVDSIAERVGLEDWYSYHILDYCYGSYTPQPVPNATVHSNDISKNVSNCSNRTALFYFDANQALENSLRDAGVDVSLDDLNWPQDIENALNAVRIAAKAAFILYCIGIGLSLVAFASSLFGFLSASRIVALINILTSTIAFLALAIASALVTAIMIKGSNAINKYGDDIGVSAQRGNKFLALTWGATGAMFLAVLVWCFECCCNSSRKSTRHYSEKP